MSRVRRVYLPLTPGLVAQLIREQALAAPLAGFAVTPRLQQAAAGNNTEELEYAALLAAAASCAELRGVRRWRRVVAAADVPPRAVAEPGDLLEGPLSQIRLVEPVLCRHVVSFHVDEHPSGSSDVDLLWFDATELSTVAALSSG